MDTRETLERAADFLENQGQRDLGDDLRKEAARIEALEAEVDRLLNPTEQYCAKCGAPKSNHPYRHPFQPRAALE